MEEQKVNQQVWDSLLLKICDKLGHKIEIESALNKYTRVYISFAKDKYYEVLK